MTIAVEAFDPKQASDDDLHRFYDLSVALEAEVEPDDPIAPFHRAIRGYVDPPSWTGNRYWIARDGDTLVGRGALYLEYVETNRHIGGVDIGVRPECRGAGVARQLLAAAVDAAGADERTVLESWPEENTPGDEFAAAMGGEARYRERRSRLLTAELDRAMLEEWVRRAEDRAGEYSLVSFDGPCPDDLVEQYIAVTEVMNTAPREDLDMEDEHWTPERLRERWARDEGDGQQRWNIIARHEPTGYFAGYTEIMWHDWSGDLVWQGATAVDPTHRNKGLGRWLKAAMLLRLIDERPEVARIDTWNAGTNKPMLGINVALGFRPVKYYNARQIATTDLAKRLGL